MIRLSPTQLDAEFRLRETGLRDGSDNQPLSDAEQLTAPEVGVVTRVREAIDALWGSMFGGSSVATLSSTPVKLEELIATPASAVASYRAAKASAKADHAIDLRRAYALYFHANQDFKLFRKLHGLERPPQYDRSAPRKLFFLALLFMVEVSVNGSFIGLASPGGFGQGWITALAISTLVVLVGVITGSFPLRFIAYRGPNGRGRVHLLWAVPFFILGLALLGAIAYYAAHYRYLLSVLELDQLPQMQILTAMRNDPLAPLQQLEAVVVMLVALAIGFLSIHRGHSWDDPYPGYGRLDRARVSAGKKHEAEAKRIQSKIEVARDEAVGALDALQKEATSHRAKLARALNEAETRAGEYDRALNALLGAGRDAIDMYRNANRELRTTHQPKYFSADPLAEFSSISSASTLRTLANAKTKTDETNDKITSNISSARDKVVDDFQSFLDDELAPFLEARSKEAEKIVKDETRFDDNDEKPN